MFNNSFQLCCQIDVLTLTNIMILKSIILLKLKLKKNMLLVSLCRRRLNPIHMGVAYQWVFVLKLVDGAKV